MNQGYRAPADWVSHEYVVNKSRFIVWVAPADSREQAMVWVQRARETYPDARHYCWAYVLGNPHAGPSAAANDDGEPSGTAGKPMLNVLQHKEIGDVVAVVIRYFGGIKLGAGGLVRAYSSATRQGIDLLAFKHKKPMLMLQIRSPYHYEPQFRRWIEDHEATLVDATYSDSICLSIRVERQHEAALMLMVASWNGVEISRIEG